MENKRATLIEQLITDITENDWFCQQASGESEMKEWEKALIVAGLKSLMGGRMTSEEVAKAIDWLETGDFEIIAGDEEYLANSSHHPNTSRFRQTAITALQALNEWNLRRL